MIIVDIAYRHFFYHIKRPSHDYPFVMMEEPGYQGNHPMTKVTSSTGLESDQLWEIEQSKRKTTQLLGHGRKYHRGMDVGGS